MRHGGILSRRHGIPLLRWRNQWGVCAATARSFASATNKAKRGSPWSDWRSGPNHVGDFAQFYWTVDVDALSTEGAHRKYALFFEPFEGRLTGLEHLP